MAEYDADREPQPIDEDAAWAAIVAGYGEEPADPPGAKPFKSVDGLALLEGDRNSSAHGTEPESRSPDKGADKNTDSAADQDPGQGADGVKPPPATPAPALGGSVVFAPGVGGPRDYEAPDAEELGEDGEGHFVPPEPPPLPESDVTAKFAWLGVVGGPVLMLVAVLLQWEMTWWLTTVCVGGFLGGFATLVARMSQGDEEDDDPGRGAVV